MRVALALVLGALVAPAGLASEVQVRLSGGLLDVVAVAAPLQDVLARLSQQTGMKVVYDGAPPRTPITVSLPQRSPVEAVLALFEGLGLNYALRTDTSGTRVDTLIVSGSGAATSLARPAPPIPEARRVGPDMRVSPDDDREEPPLEPAEERPAPGTEPSPAPPSVFSGPIPGPGQPGSPFGGQVGPLTLPTPPPQAQPPTQPQLPVPPFPVPTPSPGVDR